MENIIKPLKKINPSDLNDDFLSLFRSKSKMFSEELLRLESYINKMDTTIEFLTIFNKKGFDYAKEWIKYKLSIIEPVNQCEIDGGQLTLTKRTGHVIVFEYKNKQFEVPCKISNKREIKRFSNFVWVDGKYFDIYGNEINGLPHPLYYRGHYKGEHFFRDWKDGDHYFCLNRNGVVVRYMQMPFGASTSTRIRSTIRIVKETNIIVDITDTRWGRNYKSTYYEDFEKVKHIDLLKTPTSFGFPPLLHNYFDGDIAKTYLDDNFRGQSGFYCVFRNTPSENMATVLNIKTNEERIYEIPVLYNKSSIFVDSDGTLFVRYEDKLINLTHPDHLSVSLPTTVQILWSGLFSRKYVSCFDSSKKKINVYDRSNFVLVDTIRLSSVSDFNGHFSTCVYTEETLRCRNLFYDINSNKKKQLAELYKVLPKDIVDHIGIFVLF